MALLLRMAFGKSDSQDLWRKLIAEVISLRSISTPGLPKVSIAGLGCSSRCTFLLVLLRDEEL